MSDVAISVSLLALVALSGLAESVYAQAKKSHREGGFFACSPIGCNIACQASASSMRFLVATSSLGS
jgi:hypothetical protein